MIFADVTGFGVFIGGKREDNDDASPLKPVSFPLYS